MKNLSISPLANLWKGIKVLTVLVSFVVGIILGIFAFKDMYHYEVWRATALFFLGSGSTCFSFILAKDIEKEEEKEAKEDGEETQTVFYFDN